MLVKANSSIEPLPVLQQRTTERLAVTLGADVLLRLWHRAEQTRPLPMPAASKQTDQATARPAQVRFSWD